MMVLVTVKKDVIPTARSDGLTDFSFLTAQALALSPAYTLSLSNK